MVGQSAAGAETAAGSTGTPTAAAALHDRFGSGKAHPNLKKRAAHSMSTQTKSEANAPPIHHADSMQPPRARICRHNQSAKKPRGRLPNQPRRKSVQVILLTTAIATATIMAVLYSAAVSKISASFEPGTFDRPPPQDPNIPVINTSIGSKTKRRSFFASDEHSTLERAALAHTHSYEYSIRTAIDEYERSMPPAQRPSLDMSHCMLVLPPSIINEWYQQGVPILATAVLVHPTPVETHNTHAIMYQTRIIFTLNDLSDDDYLRWYRGTWTCNGREAKTIGSEPLPPIPLEHRRHSLVVECPPLKDEKLQRVRADVMLPYFDDGHHDGSSGGRTRRRGRKRSRIDVNTQRGHVMWKDLEEWWECQTLGHPVTQAMQHYQQEWLSFVNAPHEASSMPSSILTTRTTTTTTTTTKENTFIAAATMIQGIPVRDAVAQWVEYHRLVLGMRHFFVYLNDSGAVSAHHLQHDDTLYRRPYITYIPFGLDIPEIPFFFQQAQQNDILYRLQPYDGHVVKNPRTQNVGEVMVIKEWIAMMDVDEFIFIPPCPMQNDAKPQILPTPSRGTYTWNRWISAPWYRLTHGVGMDEGMYNRDMFGDGLCGNNTRPSQRFIALLRVYDEYVMNADDPRKVAGLAMSNTFYGRHPAGEAAIDPNAPTPLRRSASNLPRNTPNDSASLFNSEVPMQSNISICDFEWRRDITPIIRTFQRQKLLIRPSRVSYFSVHHIVHGKPSEADRESGMRFDVDDATGITKRLDPWKELRFHHYKLPHLGAHENIPLARYYSWEVWAKPEQTIVHDATSMQTACSIVKNHLLPSK